MIQQSSCSTGRHAAAGGKRDACALGRTACSQQDRVDENHLRAQMRMQRAGSLRFWGDLSSNPPPLSRRGTRRVVGWTWLPAAAGSGPWCCWRLSLGRSSSVSTAWPRPLLGWRRRVVSSPIEWRVSLVWERTVQEIQPTRPPWRGPTPLGFFRGGAREGGGGVLPRRCLQHFHARAKPGWPAASGPGAAGADHGSPLPIRVAPMPLAMSTSVAHLAAAASLRRCGG